MNAKSCSHSGQAVAGVEPSGAGCKECLATHGRWVELRMCRTCGHVGCCDSSPGKHATAHFKATEHAIIRSFERGATWSWCYVDEKMLDLPSTL